MMIDGSIKWNGNEVWASKFSCYWRVLYVENLPGKTISNVVISVRNRNAPTFGLIFTISTWLRIFKLTTGSCDVRHAIGTNLRRQRVSLKVDLISHPNWENAWKNVLLRGSYSKSLVDWQVVNFPVGKLFLSLIQWNLNNLRHYWLVADAK